MPVTTEPREQQDANQSLSETTGTLSTRGYNLIRKLGEGTYAKVYMASYAPAHSQDPSKKLLLACKVVDTAKAPRDFVRKFLPRELDILRKLNHPHIVHVHSIFQRKTKYYIFMRLAEKGDLLDWVLRHGVVTEAQSRLWLRQLALALQYLQVLDIAHRDLKCENVLITANHNVKLADFGFARYVVDARGRRVLSGTNCGSLSYAAPEILRGEHYDPRISDIWSLGVVLYIMLNKAMPFDDTNINRLYDEQIHRRWRFCSNVVDKLTEQVKRLVYNMLEPDTHKRLQVDQILASDWMVMDTRLAVCTATEAAALATAKQDRERRNRRDRVDSASSRPVVPPLGPAVHSDVREINEDDDSRWFREGASCSEELLKADPSETVLPIIEEAPQKPDEDIEIIQPQTQSDSTTIVETVNPHTQPSHGAISVMESEPKPVTPPPEFLPPDLSEKLTSKAPSVTSKNFIDQTRSEHSIQDQVIQEKEPTPSLDSASTE